MSCRNPRGLPRDVSQARPCPFPRDEPCPCSSQSSISHPALPFTFPIPIPRNFPPQSPVQKLIFLFPLYKISFLCFPRRFWPTCSSPSLLPLPLLPTSSRIPGSCLLPAVSTAVIKPFKKRRAAAAAKKKKLKKPRRLPLFLPLGRATCFIGTGIYGHINVELLLPP